MFPLYSIVLLVAGSLGSCHPQQCHSNSTHIQEDKISLLSLATQHNHTSKTGWAHQAINGNHPICLVGCTLHIKYVYIYTYYFFDDFVFQSLYFCSWRFRSWGAVLPHIQGNCEKVDGKVRHNRLKFISPGYPLPGLKMVRFTPKFYTVTEGQPVLEKCVQTDWIKNDPRQLVFLTGRHKSEAPAQHFMSQISHMNVAGYQQSWDREIPDKLNFAFYGTLKMEFTGGVTRTTELMRFGQASVTSPLTGNEWWLGGPNCQLQAEPTFRHSDKHLPVPCVLKCGELLFDISATYGDAESHEIIVRDPSQIADKCKRDR